MYSKVGSPSIPPEQLLRALLLQILYIGAQRAAAGGRDRLHHIVLISRITYCNAVQVLSGLNSLIAFARLAVSLPRFFS